jgi:hypothetical protein
LKIYVQLSESKATILPRAVKKAALKIKSTYNEREWWKKLSPQEQADYLQEHPTSSMSVRHNGIVKNIVHAGVSKAVNKIKKNRMEYKEGIDGIKNFKHGRELSDTQKEGVKKIAKAAAAVLVVGLAAALMFTPAGGAAMQITNDFLGKYFNREDKEAVAADSDDDYAQEFLNELGTWLKTQDVLKYAKS